MATWGGAGFAGKISGVGKVADPVTVAWSPPTLVGNRLYVRDRKVIRHSNLVHPMDKSPLSRSRSTQGSSLCAFASLR